MLLKGTGVWISEGSAWISNLGSTVYCISRSSMLQAYEDRRVYPRALFMVVGWYAPNWWRGTTADQEDLMERYGCTVAHREAVLNFTIGARKAGRRFTDASRVADSGIVWFDYHVVVPTPQGFG